MTPIDAKALEDAAVARVRAARDAMALHEDDEPEPEGPPWWMVIAGVVAALVTPGLALLVVYVAWRWVQ